MKETKTIKKKIKDLTIAEGERVCIYECDGRKGQFKGDLDWAALSWYCARCPLHVNVIDEVDKKWDWLCIRHLLLVDFEKWNVLMSIDDLAKATHKTKEEVINLLKKELERKIRIPKKDLTQKEMLEFYNL